MSNLKEKCNALMVELGGSPDRKPDLTERKMLLSSAVRRVSKQLGVDLAKTKALDNIQCLTESDWSCFVCEINWWKKHSKQPRLSSMVEFVRRARYDPLWRWNYPEIGEVWASVNDKYVVVESENVGNTYRRLAVLRCMEKIINREKEEES